jgi:hypothetical protein
VVGADHLAGVDLLELVAAWQTFTNAEVRATVLPTGCRWAWQPRCWDGWPSTWRASPVPTRPRAPGGPAAAGAALLAATSNEAWIEAWPIRLVGTAFEAMDASRRMQLEALEVGRANPRDLNGSWHAARTVDPAARETYVVIIGESLRSDHMNGCGGDARIQATPVTRCCSATSSRVPTARITPCRCSSRARRQGTRNGCPPMRRS